MSHNDDTVSRAVDMPGSDFTAPEISIVSPPTINQPDHDDYVEQYEPEGGRAIRGLLVAGAASFIVFWIPVAGALYVIKSVIAS